MTQILPKDALSRESLRRAYAAEVIKEARVTSVLCGLSLNCRKDTLADLEIGVSKRGHVCKNDGSTCLCICHDVKNRR